MHTQNSRQQAWLDFWRQIEADYNRRFVINPLSAVEQSAFDALYTDLRRRMLASVAWRLDSRSVETAEEVVDDAFVSLWKAWSRGRLQSPEHQVAYVWSAARSRIRDHGRRTAVRPVCVSLEGRGVKLLPAPPDVFSVEPPECAPSTSEATPGVSGGLSRPDALRILQRDLLRLRNFPAHMCATRGFSRSEAIAVLERDFAELRDWSNA